MLQGLGKMCKNALWVRMDTPRFTRDAALVGVPCSLGKVHVNLQEVPQRLGIMHKSVVQDRNSAQEFSMDQEGCMGLSKRCCKGQGGQAKV